MAANPSSKVHFFSDSVTVSLQEKTRLKVFIESLFKKEKTKLVSLNYIFCSDARLLVINQDFLNHDDYTDIITFDLSEPGSGTTGEIYISIDRVRENARLHNTTIKEELHRVLFHGALHLCGYRDKTASEKVLMRSKEDFYLKRYFK